MYIAASVIILLDWKCGGQGGKPQSAVSLAVTVTAARRERECNPNLNRSQTGKGQGEERPREDGDKNTTFCFYTERRKYSPYLTRQSPRWIKTAGKWVVNYIPSLTSHFEDFSRLLPVQGLWMVSEKPHRLVLKCAGRSNPLSCLNTQHLSRATTFREKLLMGEDWLN